MNPRLPILAALFSVAATACSPRFTSLDETSPVKVQRVVLKWSSVYLLSGKSDVLVDAGSPHDTADLTAALADLGKKPSDIRVVVVTHGHVDHAGTARFLQKHGAKIVVGKGDEALARAGHNDELKPTSLFARSIRWMFEIPYEPFTPDVVVESSLDLSTEGLPGVRVQRMPGHTLGSIVVLTDRQSAFVGDQMLGGLFGGAFDTKTAGEHYYQRDVHENHCNVQRLLDAGTETFYLGHGGPVTRDAVLVWRRGWEDELARCGRP